MMADRKKVVKELSELHGSKETMEIIEQAIVLLKEQEAVYPSWQNGKMCCGHCGSKFPPRVMMRFCHRCGVPIKLKVNDIV